MPDAPTLALSDVSTNPRAGTGLRGIDLQVAAGEIVTVLGPRGAGTSALLRVLAGLVGPSAGQVKVAGRDAAGLSPRRRGVILVEQPAPGLRWRSGPSLAQALAARPAALLLEDPTRGLDPADAEAVFDRLRAARDLGAAILCTTSLPEPAIALGDRMAVLLGGAIRQQGPPLHLYERPADAEVAAATGEANLLAATVLATEEGTVRAKLAGGHETEIEAEDAEAHTAGAACLVCLRPEHLALGTAALADVGESALAAVTAVTPYGPYWRVALDMAGARLVARRPAGGLPPRLAVGGHVSVAWQPHHARVFTATPGVIGKTQAVAATVPRR